MVELRDWLEKRQPDLVESLVAAIQLRPGAVPLPHQQVSALVLALSVAIDQGPEILQQVMDQWSQEDEVAHPDGGRWSHTLAAIRDTLWASIISEFSPVHALSHLKVLESLLVDAILIAAELDQKHRLDRLHQESLEIQERLRTLEQSKANFISIAAHELKTPLTLIEGYANMLMLELPEDIQAKAGILLGGIANGTIRLHEIIESMIDISLIDTDVLEISYQPIYLRHIVRMTARDLTDVFRIRRIELLIEDLPEDGAPSYGDPGRLYQAFYNVLGNAIKYTPDGGQIKVSNLVLPPNDDDGPDHRGYLHLRITDTGIGISTDSLERIFDKFAVLGNVALHSTSKYKFKGGGPGLGLAITRGIVEAHRGRIWAESTGHNEETLPGSTFHILLPLFDAPPEVS